jgi:hypothetical protein
MPRKTKTEKVVDESVIEQLATEIVQSVSKDEPKKEEPVKYVVVRDDRRVSDHEYTDPKDPKAVEERDFWKRVCEKWSPSERAEIVKFNKKKHRNW